MAEHYFEVEPGIELHYRDEGSGRPLIFIPGWTFSIDVFEKQIAYFSTRYRVIAVDPRNHGKSTISVNRNTYDVQGADLGKLIDHLDLKNVVLAGWSFGGLTLWSYVEQFGTQNISAAVTIDVSPRTLSSDSDEWVAGTLEDLIAVHNHSLDSAEHYRQFIDSFAENLLFDHAITAEEKSRFTAPSLRIPHQIADALYVDGWLTDKKAAAKTIDETVPSLTFTSSARADAATPYIQKEFPNSDVHSFGNHLLFWEYADRFNEILDQFLNKHQLSDTVLQKS
ncbi:MULTISPECIES: alpha/beta fold hydrolase [Sporolactobacillus]|uniref:Pimeloyl-ACP methyl ester carboxylesterase n=1 Tax=Sporolactobacillus nakayamae TaxID=269670 RepID=A0A1I2TRM1_9BACL|nr:MULTISPECIES: alpha/beta hydrolase [Sporolactobacillus]MCQ2010204.1 alpha/beta hydrolase [Sporolactobacillus sp. STSJ-5]SFG66027.1 Pimeloyl-ACP methyl ester carboxylesterase [Sporolactobacillus nakayamae]